jgi:dephospho-CoA kinase
MFLVGLTGGIASGKSSVADVWEYLGAEVVDADELAREVVLPGSVGLSRISEEFGVDILSSDGTLNRKSLADRIFSDSEKREKLESILHPLIRELAEEKLGATNADLVVYVIPLLAETKSDLPFDYIVTVEAPEEDQIQRMTEFRGMSREEAMARIKAQARPAERANVADRILNSNQSLKLLQKDASRLFSELKLLAQAKNSIV